MVLLEGNIVLEKEIEFCHTCSTGEKGYQSERRSVEISDFRRKAMRLHTRNNVSDIHLKSESQIEKN